MDGAVATVRALSRSLPLAVASSSNRPLIDAVLEAAGIAPCFAATVSSEEVARGKPSPDVYLEAARRLGIEPDRCAAVEDSANGIRAAHAAEMRVIAYPNRRYPPDAESLALAHDVIASLAELAAVLAPASALGLDSNEGSPAARDPRRTRKACADACLRNHALISTGVPSTTRRRRRKAAEL